MEKNEIKDEITDYDYLDREEAEYQGYEAEEDYYGYSVEESDSEEEDASEFDEPDGEESEENDLEDENQSDDEEDTDSYTIDGVVYKDLRKYVLALYKIDITQQTQQRGEEQIELARIVRRGMLCDCSVMPEEPAVPEEYPYKLVDKTSKVLRRLHQTDEEKAWIESLDDEEKHRIISEGRAAQDKLISGNLPLVMDIARQVSSQMEYLDRIQTGNIGLQKAVQYYNPNKGVQFDTFATHLIKHEIQEYSEKLGQQKTGVEEGVIYTPTEEDIDAFCDLMGGKYWMQEITVDTDSTEDSIRKQLAFMIQHKVYAESVANSIITGFPIDYDDVLGTAEVDKAITLESDEKHKHLDIVKGDGKKPKPKEMSTENFVRSFFIMVLRLKNISHEGLAAFILKDKALIQEKTEFLKNYLARPWDYADPAKGAPTQWTKAAPTGAPARETKTVHTGTPTQDATADGQGTKTVHTGMQKEDAATDGQEKKTDHKEDAAILDLEQLIQTGNIWPERCIINPWIRAWTEKEADLNDENLPVNDCLPYNDFMMSLADYIDPDHPTESIAMILNAGYVPMRQQEILRDAKITLEYYNWFLDIFRLTATERLDEQGAQLMEDIASGASQASIREKYSMSPNTVTKRKDAILRSIYDQIIASTNSDKGEILFNYLKLSYQASIISRWKKEVIGKMVSDHYIEKGRFALRSRGEEDSPRPIMESFHRIVMKGNQAGTALLEFKDDLDRSVGEAVQKVRPTFAELKNSIDRSVGAAAQKIEPVLVKPAIGAGLQKMIPSVLELKKKLDQSVGAALQKVHDFTSSDAYEEWKKRWIEEEGIDEDEDLFGIAPDRNDTGIPD